MHDVRREVVGRLARARSAVVFTGAGISAESGVPTFRDPGGVWEKFRPEELANIRAFLANPELVQGWYAHRRQLMDSVEPNPGHVAIADLEQLVPELTVVTQNVDGLHARAGSLNILELHGNIHRNYCIDCRQDADVRNAVSGEAVRCKTCGGLVRPDVVWFGEMLDPDVIGRADAAARTANVFLSVGTSGLVYPAADLPLIARRSGAYVVEVNVTPSVLANHLDDSISGPAGEVLPELVRQLRRRGADRETA